MKKLIYRFSIVASMLFFLSSCGPSAVVVRTRPQPPIYARPVAPARNYVWVEGEWIRSGRGYNYRQGYWAAPRARYHQYRPGHWQQRRGGWYWAPGRWN